MNRPFISDNRIMQLRVWSGFGFSVLRQIQSDRENCNYYPYCLHDDDIISYSASNSLTKCYKCGEVVSGTFSLTITKEAYDGTIATNSVRFLFRIGQMVYAELTIYSDDGSVIEHKDFGVWRIEKVVVNEYDSVVTISGSDELAHIGNIKLNDTRTYTSTTKWSDPLSRICTALINNCGLYTDLGTDNYMLKNKAVFKDVTINPYAARAPWWGGLTDACKGKTIDEVEIYRAGAREMLSIIAGMSLGFAFIDLSGYLQIHTFSRENLYPSVITEPYMFSLEDSQISCKPRFILVDQVSYRYTAADGFTSVGGLSNVLYDVEYGSSFMGHSVSTGYRGNGIIRVVDDRLPIEGGYNYCAELSENVENLGKVNSGSVEFIGDPDIWIGDNIYISETDEVESPDAETFDVTANTAHNFIVTSIRYEFNGGLKCTIESSVSSDEEAIAENADSFGIDI